MKIIRIHLACLRTRTRTSSHMSRSHSHSATEFIQKAATRFFDMATCDSARLGVLSEGGARPHAAITAAASRRASQAVAGPVNGLQRRDRLPARPRFSAGGRRNLGAARCMAAGRTSPGRNRGIRREVVRMLKCEETRSARGADTAAWPWRRERAIAVREDHGGERAMAVSGP